MKKQPVKTDKNKSFCNICGTYTIDRKVCTNSYHKINKKRCIKNCK